MRYEEPTWAGPYFGEFGVLADDGDKAQCHICGDLYDNVGSHANKTHGLTADWYRHAFGLYQATSLIGPTFRAKRSRISAEHLRQVGEPNRERTRNLTTQERKAAMANVARRKQHDLNRTPPERMHAVREALYGDPRGHTDEYLIEVTDMFLDELERGQRGVYKRMGVRMGVDWSVARSRVWQAVRRGHLIWTGDDLEPAGHRPGEQPWHPPGSFEDRFNLLVAWVAEHGHARVPKVERVGDVKLGYRVQSQRSRHCKGNLSEERILRLEALPGWAWYPRPSLTE